MVALFAWNGIFILDKSSYDNQKNPQIKPVLNEDISLLTIL